MIRATKAHRSALEAALRRDADEAMFPLGNLITHGIDGTSHPNATIFWLDADAPRVVLGLSEWGMAMVHAPDGLDAGAVAEVLRGTTLRGISGPAGPVRTVMKAAGLASAPTTLDADEPQFSLDLGSLLVPAGDGDLTPLDRDTALRWRAAYIKELHFGALDAEEIVAQVDEWIARDTHRLLLHRGQPLVLTGFNAILPDIVQVGGVYVPPALRGNRHARRAVALHLAEARERGVARATLFAASDAAARAYVALGFARIGTFALVLFDGTVIP